MMEKKRLLFCFLMAMLMPFFMMPVAARTSTAQFSLHDTRGQLSESPVFSKAAPNPDDERPAAAPASDNESIPVVQLNADSTTLTFTYAAASTVDNTTTYPLSWMNNSDKACQSKVKKVVFDRSFSEARPTSTDSWFAHFKQLQTIEGLEYLNTSEVTNMSGMFDSCSSLTSLDLSSFNTSNVTDMRGMFGYCSSLASLDLSSLNTSKVTDMGAMFDGCKSLTSLDLSKFNTNKVTNMGWMFEGCSSLTSLDLSSFNTNEVTDMGGMFGYCSSLTSLDLSNFNTSKVTSMAWMFISCSSLTSLNVSNFNTSKVTDMSGMFYDCSSLTSLELSSFNTSKVTDMNGMFWDCSSLTSLDLSNFNTSNVTDMNGMFDGCSSLTSLDLSNFNTSNVIGMGMMFNGCSSLTSLDLSNFNTSNVIGMGMMFNGCSSLTSLDLSNFNTSNVIDMGWIFKNCSSLTSLDLSSFNTSNVNNMNGMFEGCSSLTSLDLSNFNTSKVGYINSMFEGCSHLREINLGNNDFKDVTQKNNALKGVGTVENPCVLIIAPDFDKSVLGELYTGTTSYYSWLGGYVSLSSASIVADYDNIIYLNDVQATAGEKLALKMRLKNTEKILGLQFDLRLPDGFTVDQSENGKYNLTVSTARDADESLDYHPSNMISKNVYRAIAVSTQHVTIAPGDDEVLTLVLNVDKSVAPGEYVFALDSIVLVKDDLGSIDLSGTTFQSAVTVVAAFDGVVLDEDSATPPTKSDGPVNVKVLRTMNGGEWATLCLPFAMTGEQVKAAFGDDVQLADYAGWEPFYASDEDELPSTITVSFNRLDADNGIVANHPYVIKPSAGITAFVADNVTIDPKNNPSVSTGSNRQHNLGSFTGTYVADFTVPQASLFISGDKFWYSVGKTKMKAFRAYFEFTDVLASYYDGSAAKVNFTLNDATGIDNASVRPSAASGRVYTLGGQLVSTRGTGRLPKGIYIVDGKKIAVK